MLPPSCAYLPAIWRVPAAGGDEVPIVRDVASYGNFAVAREGIYFEHDDAGDHARSDLSADGRTLLFGQMDSFTEDLMLVENFR